MTGATGDLTPDDVQRDFEPGEWREASDAKHQADVTRSQASHAATPEDPSEPIEDRPKSSRDQRIGGDELQDEEEHL